MDQPSVFLSTQLQLVLKEHQNQQQYHQRTYSTQTPAEMPDWLRQSLEEAASNEQK